MGKASLSAESGVVCNGDSTSSLKHYFENFIPRLSRVVNDIGDPTIDLELIEEGSRAICEASPPPARKQAKTTNGHDNRRTSSTDQTFEVEKENISSMSIKRKTDSSNAVECAHQHQSLISEQADVTVHELTHIVDMFKNNNPYSNKLKNIMLKGLEDTLGQEYFQLFLKVGFPKHTFPIVKMNQDNTPYVELLIKSEKSDQDPHSQLTDYTATHMAYSDFIVEQLRVSRNSSSSRREQPVVPMCSTPKHNKIPPRMQYSKRIQPVRACRYR